MRWVVCRGAVSPAVRAVLHASEERPPQETCVICHERIEAGASVVFTPDGVAHADCFLNGRRTRETDSVPGATA